MEKKCFFTVNLTFTVDFMHSHCVVAAAINISICRRHQFPSIAESDVMSFPVPSLLPPHSPILTTLLYSPSA